MNSPKTPMIAKLIELKAITSNGPTVKLASDNMRSLLSSVAMVTAASLVYHRGYCPWVTKPSAMFIGLWATAYACLAVWQFMYLVFAALSYSLIYNLGPKKAEILYPKIRYLMSSIAIVAMIMVLSQIFVLMADITFK